MGRATVFTTTTTTTTATTANPCFHRPHLFSSHHQGQRLLAVRSFKGTQQDETYKEARKELLAKAKSANLETVKTAKGRSRVWVLRNDMKLGFNLKGSLSITHWEQKMFTDTNEIAVEISQLPSSSSSSSW